MLIKTELTQHCVDNVGDVGGGVVWQQQRVVGGELKQQTHQHYHQAIIFYSIIAFLRSHLHSAPSMSTRDCNEPSQSFHSILEVCLGLFSTVS